VNYYYSILVFILILLPWGTNSQVRNPYDTIGEETEEPVKAPDKKVLSRVVGWNVRNQGAFIDSAHIDTLHQYYHNYHPVFKNSITNTYTGNYGGAYLNNDFFLRTYSSGFYFARTHDAYLLTPDHIVFYNTTTPYTMLDYSQSENKNRQNETRFNVLHSQNVNKDLNLTFRFDQAKSDGQYNYQENKNNSLSVYSSYTKEKISAYAGFISNRIRNTENGGMADDSQLLEVERPEYMSMILTDARSEIKNTYLFAIGEYKLGTTVETDTVDEFRPIASILYQFKLEHFIRQFWEGDKSNNSAYFPDFYLNPEFTHDSVRYRTVQNQVQLLFHESAQKKFSFGQRAFIGVEVASRMFSAPGYENPVFPWHRGVFEKHLYMGPSPRYNKASYTNVYIGGGIFRHLGNFWTWDIEGKQYVTGYLAGQTELNGVLYKPVQVLNDSTAFFRIKGALVNRVPDYFGQEYFSNRFQWKNNFVNEQNMTASFEFSAPARRLDAGMRYALFNNFLYHGYDGMPMQANREQLILSVFAGKEMTWRNFGLKTRLLWQKASAEQYIHLPEFSVRLVPSYDLLIAKVLYTQIGVDVRFNTAYYADAYNPATGFFYLQNEKLLGSYPYMDAFANLKLKRTRVFFQYMNFGSRFLNKPYFTALSHPMNQATFRLGVAWSFYN
jgi:hypothetical protein